MSKSFPSIQEELIALSEQKYQEALNTPGMKPVELELAEHLVQLFKDEEKIRAVPRTVITGGLVFYGIDCAEDRNYRIFTITPDGYEVEQIFF